MNRRQMAETAGRIVNIRARLIQKNPFFAHLAMGLQIACAECGTACTDGKRLIFDPEFAQRLSDSEIEFVILHEVLHCVLGHLSRADGLIHSLFNTACDTVVNSLIMDMWRVTDFKVAGETPVHLTPDEQEGRLFTAEQVYAMLLDNLHSDGNTVSYALLDRHDIWRTAGEPAQLQRMWKMRIEQASKFCSDTSCLPPVLRDVIDRTIRPSRINWRHLLQDFLEPDIFDYSYTPPDRRFTDSDFLLPAYNITDTGGSVRNLWICIDTSASISDRELASIMSDVLDAVYQTGMHGIFSFFDTRITEPAPFDDEKALLERHPIGGGGTSFHTIFEFLSEHMDSMQLPKAILVFTDGYASCPDESAAMGIPVFWLITKGGRTDFPFGIVAELN